MPFAKASFGEGGVAGVAKVRRTIVGVKRVAPVVPKTPGKRRIVVRGIIDDVDSSSNGEGEGRKLHGGTTSMGLYQKLACPEFADSRPPVLPTPSGF